MKLQYLGTAAAEGVPALFCSCEVCRKTEESKGKSIRTRSQAVVDDSLLIDFPSDTYMHSIVHGLDLKKIKHIIITHNHRDHLYAEDFTNLTEGFSHYKSDEPITIYGVIPTLKEVRSALRAANCNVTGRLELEELIPFEKVQIKNYSVIPLKANHDMYCEPLFFDISDGKKRILYANDTGIFPDETWDYINNIKPYYDIISLDCTMGLISCRNSHMGIVECAETKDKLISISAADQNTKFILNHFSHNGGLTYDEMLLRVKDLGFDVSYDGMTINA